jgi:hypothetical protein
MNDFLPLNKNMILAHSSSVNNALEEWLAEA